MSDSPQPDNLPVHSDRASLAPHMAIHIAMLGLVAAYFWIWPLWRAAFPMEITPNEGWNAYYQDAAVNGVLYPAADALIVNNYPPISFYLIGWLGHWLGDSLYVGRALSAFSVVGLSVAIGLAARRAGGGAIGGTIGGIWFMALMASPFNRFTAMNDPQLFAQLIMTVALVWFLERDHRGLSAVPPILLMVVAGFIKHNIVVIPATVLLWLAIRDGRRAVKPIVIGVAAAVAGILICVAIYGDAFASNMLAPRKYSLLRILFNIGRLQWVLPAWVIWAIWAWQMRHTAAARFTALYISLGFFFYLVQWAGEAVVDNAQFDLDIAVAIGLGVAYERIGDLTCSPLWTEAKLRTLIVCVLAVRLLATGRIEPALILFDPSYRAQFAANAMVVESETARIRAIPGNVWCTFKTICRRAGKPFSADDFTIEEMLATKRITQPALAQLLKQRHITVAVIDERAKMDVLNRNLFSSW